MKDLFNSILLPLTFIGGALFIVANAPTMSRNMNNTTPRENPRGRRLTSSRERELDEEDATEFEKNKNVAKKQIEAMKRSDEKTRTRRKVKSKTDQLTDLMIVKAFFEE